MDINKIMESLSDDEKIALVSGRDFMNTNSIPRLGIPRVTMADGPHGVRKQLGVLDNGVSPSEPAVAFPTASAIASSRNPDNAYKMGIAIAEEAIHYGVNVMLGPGINIKRNPLCGRNFEYFSEDPYLTGVMGSAEVSGIQSQGVSACVKHYALNNNENFRFMGESIADKRAENEIYLKAFETVVKAAKPDAVMSAYNKLHGKYCAESKELLSDILRDKWGFSGIVMSDWGGVHRRDLALSAGLDLEMPGDSTYARRLLYDALADDKDGSFRHSLDESVYRILKLASKHDGKSNIPCDLDKHHELAARIAEDSAVLLKNEGALPLSRGEKLLIVGELFEKMRYQGAGSSMINATKLTSPRSAFDEADISYKYAKGYLDWQNEPDTKLIEEAISSAEGVDKIILFIGLTDYAESEGIDRDGLTLPESQSRLVREMLNLGKPTVAVLFGGAPFEIPEADKFDSILAMYLPGQAGGIAVYNLLFGNVSPSGRLAETWMKSYPCVPFGEEFAKMEREAYKESVFVGYRHYQRIPENVLFPFGYGLSYASFEYQNPSLSMSEDAVQITLTVKNTSERFAGEAIDIYVKKPNSGILDAGRELCAFDKVYLTGGEACEITFKIPIDELRVYDIKADKWVLCPGEYEFSAGDSQSKKITLSAKLKFGELPTTLPEDVLAAYADPGFSLVNDEIFEKLSGICLADNKPADGLITPESRFSEMQRKPIGRLMRKIVLYYIAEKRLKKAKRLPPSALRENEIKSALFLKNLLDSSSVTTLSMSSSGKMPFNIAAGLCDMANGKIFSGLIKILKRIKVPKLPEELSQK